MLPGFKLYLQFFLAVVALKAYHPQRQMLFAHLIRGMENDQAYSQLLKLERGIKNRITNLWDWEYE